MREVPQCLFLGALWIVGGNEVNEAFMLVDKTENAGSLLVEGLYEADPAHEEFQHSREHGIASGLGDQYMKFAGHPVHFRPQIVKYIALDGQMRAQALDVGGHCSGASEPD